MSQPTRPVPPEQDRRFGRAVCERLGIDPALVDEDLRWEVIGGEELWRIDLTVYLPAEEILAAFNAAALSDTIAPATPPRCAACIGHGWTGSRHDSGPYGGHYHCHCGAPCAVDNAEGCTGARQEADHG